MTPRSRRLLRHAGIYARLAPFLLIALFPVVWMAITAFKHEQDLYRMQFPLWFTETWFGTWVANTAAVASLVVGITLAAAVPAAYALARLRLPGADGAGIGIFMTYLVPPIILFIPLCTWLMM